MQVRGFPGGSVIKNCLLMKETCVQSLVGKDPLEKEMATTPVLLPGKSHGQRSLVGYSPWVAKSQTQLRDYTTTMRVTVHSQS